MNDSEHHNAILKTFKVEIFSTKRYLHIYPDIYIFYIWLYTISIIGFVMN